MYFEKQIKDTARADNKNSVSPAKKYPCFSRGIAWDNLYNF